ncbi:hypothetical protein [Acetobacter peroxydans]|jgi:uncharacterized membrane protein|uniref:Copper resistance protein D domain-containing protein n=1 Tax=Acetobacter peroxydans TaxID=104098 RepID=A0A4Y3TT44_9PROT|nr:hypothetical protein [Acetobacter peroxydans]MCH4142561.1 hypothetical protein [Acetobacter peroxydans]MCI1394738.1 hypothetical protein [Acetobacter peroxydans]MCI1410772.1 hypothetical protein [Acetobacter peroxydans]MCI1566044.1 hypothetical protein [Acetobacter peroxydans]MCI1618207.1 hypothetical protein [Acetobacter peroxydans]
MPHSLLWSLVLAVHIISIALWIGGIFYAVAILRPSLGLLDATQRTSIMLQTMSRFFKGLTHAIPTALISGWLLILHEGGFANAPWTVNAMQAFGIIMAGLFARLYFGPFQKVRRAIRPQASAFDSIRTQMLIIMALGFLAILSACLSHPFV